MYIFYLQLQLKVVICVPGEAERVIILDVVLVQAATQ